MKSEFYDALDLIQKEKGVSKSYMLEKIKAGIVSSVRRDKQVPADNVDVTFNEEAKTMRVFIKKNVVEQVSFPSIEISLEQAQQLDPKYQIGDVVEFDCDPSSVGRIAAKVGKNVIIQAINEAVNGSLIQEFEEMKGTVVTGVVSRVDERGKCIYVMIKDYEMQMFEKDLVPGEKPKDGDRLKVCIADVRRGSKSQEILLSRSNAEFLRCLFQIEVPEIADGTIEIKGIAREAGSRSKVAVLSHDENVDALGACIGPKQARINAVVSNIRGERIDLIRYSDKPEEYIIASLSPANVHIHEIDVETKTCRVSVPADQLSLAIGKTGQNVRLAARLTGFKIDIIAE